MYMAVKDIRSNAIDIEMGISVFFISVLVFPISKIKNFPKKLPTVVVISANTNVVSVIDPPNERDMSESVIEVLETVPAIKAVKITAPEDISCVISTIIINRRIATPNLAAFLI